jgi:DNA-binding GntR family transcriptional regulator
MKSLNRYVLTDELYTLLKEQIKKHQLAPGEKINIDQLARTLQVSNIPIREVLSRLVSEGLVKTIPFKGMFVTGITLQELDEIMEIRLELETLAVRLSIPNIPDFEITSNLNELQIYDNQPTTSIDERLSLLIRMNENVHGLILQHCGNQMLRQLIRQYIERIERYLSFIPGELDANTLRHERMEHELIVHALSTRNVQQAVEAMRNHLLLSHQRTRVFFSPHP